MDRIRPKKKPFGFRLFSFSSVFGCCFMGFSAATVSHKITYGADGTTPYLPYSIATRPRTAFLTSDENSTIIRSLLLNLGIKEPHSCRFKEMIVTGFTPVFNLLNGKEIHNLSYGGNERRYQN